MKWDILHRTEYRYGTPARESFNEVRLRPSSNQDQVVDSFELRVFPQTQFREYRDFYANSVHHFEIPERHESLRIESAVRAQTSSPEHLNTNALLFPLDRIGEAARNFRCHDFLNPSKYVDVDPATWRLALDAIDGRADTWQAALAVMRFVHGHVCYAPNTTQVHTHMREVLARRQGVCQDLAHVALGLYRCVKIPALYVSGYLATEAASATHAWVEVFIPSAGWRGLDPTHNCQTDESYLKLAIGRDYDDVAPVTGHYKGTLERKMEVAVQISTQR